MAAALPKILKAVDIAMNVSQVGLGYRQIGQADAHHREETELARQRHEVALQTAEELHQKVGHIARTYPWSPRPGVYCTRREECDAYFCCRYV
jgi:hypothetical protein